MNKKIVELRNLMKMKKPIFTKQSSHKKVRVGTKYRQARGSDSKVKRGYKGYVGIIKVGYKSPNEARGLSREGLKIIYVKNVNDLNGIKKNEEVVCLAGIGRKKKVEVIKKCIELGLMILSMKDPAKFLQETEDIMKSRKEKQKKKKEEKAKKTEDKKEKKKEGIEAKVENDQESKEKKEKDKLLTKREI